MASVDRWFEKTVLGRKESPALRPENRVCNWCRNKYHHSEWEYVNGRRWYHKPCIDLMDMIA